MYKQIYKIQILFLIVSIMSCTPEATQSLESTNDFKRGQITVTKEQAKAIGLEFGKLDVLFVSKGIAAYGYLETPPQNRAKISSNVSGNVTNVNYLVGDYVKKGNEIIRIESIEFLVIQKNYITMKSALKYLEDDYMRQKKLAEQNVNAKKIYFKAEKDYLSAKAEFELADKKLDILQASKQEIQKGNISPYHSIRAPISGYVSEMYSVISEFINAEDILVEIINPEHMHAELNVYESDALKIKKGQKVEITVPQNEDLNMIGEVFLVGKELDEQSRSVDIHVHIPEKDNLLVGMYIEGKILLDPQNVIAIPEKGLIQEEDASYIYMMTSQTENDYTIKKVFVNPGIENNGLVAIEFTEEVDTTQMVAVSGIYYLSSSTN